jgi:hypothetical protein
MWNKGFEPGTLLRGRSGTDLQGQHPTSARNEAKGKSTIQNDVGILAIVCEFNSGIFECGSISFSR